MLTQASAADRAWLQSVGFFTEAVEASPLDKLPAEQQLVATTILERQGKPVPVEAEADIAALAERFAQADAGMWAAARAMADGVEPKPVADEEEVLAVAAVEQWVKQDAEIEAMIVSPPEPEPVKAEPKPKLKVHRPEPEPVKKVHAVFEDIVFDDDLIAKMMANMASHGMTLEDIAG